MHPADLNERMAAALADEPPRRTLLWWSPELAELEHRQWERTLQEHWVQAHPPFVTVMTVPLFSAFGVLGTQIAFTMVSGFALLLAVACVYWKFGLQNWQTLGLAMLIAVFGWSATVSAFRLQQLSLPLLGLLCLAWVLLRRGHNGWGGFFIGLAICCKLIPGVLLLPLAVRHHRAFLAAVGTMLGVYLFVFALVPLSDLIDYRRTASQVVDEYAGYGTNISLLGFFARGVRDWGGPLDLAKGLWILSLGGIGIIWARGLFRQPTPGANRRDLVDGEFALGMSLIPLLSPVSWDHYLVLLLLPLAVLGHNVRQYGGRTERIGLAVLLVALAIPDATYLWLHELFEEDAPRFLVWVVEPFRTYAMLGLTGWLGHLFRQQSSSQFSWAPVAHDPGPEPKWQPLPLT
jgi:hypothetical protein